MQENLLQCNKAISCYNKTTHMDRMVLSIIPLLGCATSKIILSRSRHKYVQKCIASAGLLNAFNLKHRNLSYFEFPLMYS